MRAVSGFVIVLAGCGRIGFDDKAGVTDSTTDSTTDSSMPSIDAPMIDSSPGACAAAGARVCVDGTTAGYCNGSLQPVADRPCPPMSPCSAGHCQPPSGATACQRQADCSVGQVCDMYVVGGLLGGSCTAMLGTGGMGASCSPAGNNASCQTGICAIDGEDSSHQQCFFPCRAGINSDCVGLSCHMMNTALGQPDTIEGVTLITYGCFL